MRRMTITQLQNNPSKALEDLPIEIVRYTETVAYIVSPDKYGGNQVHVSGVEPGIVETTVQRIKREAQEAYKADATSAKEVVMSEDFIVPALSVLKCRYCGVKKECNKVEYTDVDGNNHEYNVCVDDMKVLSDFQKSTGGTILTVNGKKYE